VWREKKERRREVLHQPDTKVKVFLRKIRVSGVEGAMTIIYKKQGEGGKKKGGGKEGFWRLAPEPYFRYCQPRHLNDTTIGLFVGRRGGGKKKKRKERRRRKRKGADTEAYHKRRVFCYHSACLYLTNYAS